MKKADGSMTEEDLIGDWLVAKERQVKAEDELSSARCALTNKTNEVARRLVPKDAQVGEKLSVRYFDAFYVVEKTDASGLGSFKIEKRRSS